MNPTETQISAEPLLKILQLLENNCCYIGMAFEYDYEKQKFLDLFDKIEKLLPQ